MKDIELKPCPFFGGEATLCSIVRCRECKQGEVDD